MAPHVPYGADVPGMKALVGLPQGQPPRPTRHDALYVRGWTGGHGLGRGAQARRQGRQARPARASRAALETFKDFDLGGLTSPVTWTATDHRPSTKTSVFMVKGGKLVKVKEYDMPRKAEWLGM